MSKEKIVKKAGWALGILVVLAVVAVFATVNNAPTDNQRTVSEPVPNMQPVSLTSLESIVKARKTWDLAFESWAGKSASDFKIKGIDGQTHNLSDYRGKNVLVVFWATWCPACNVEIPHLIELRKMYPADELAILAISNQSLEELKSFAADKGINYTVATLGSTLPEPFSKVTSIPTTFYIDREGKIKLTALGVVSVEESKAIIEAEAGY